MDSSDDSASDTVEVITMRQTYGGMGSAGGPNMEKEAKGMTTTRTFPAGKGVMEGAWMGSEEQGEGQRMGTMAEVVARAQGRGQGKLRLG